MPDLVGAQVSPLACNSGIPGTSCSAEPSVLTRHNLLLRAKYTYWPSSDSCGKVASAGAILTARPPSEDTFQIVELRASSPLTKYIQRPSRDQLGKLLPCMSMLNLRATPPFGSTT